MKIEMMDRPVTREKFERRFNLLHRQMAEGKFHMASGLKHTSEGIERVRYLPNGRIDFLSVDESARLTANTISNFSGEKFENLIDSSQEPDVDG